MKYALYGSLTNDWLFRSDGYAFAINSPALDEPPGPVIDELIAWTQAADTNVPEEATQALQLAPAP